VAESQVEDYEREKLGVPILPHPDNIKGIVLKRQWIYEKFGSVLMLDDDITSFVRCYLPKYKSRKKFSRMSMEDATDMLNATYLTAKNMGAKLWSIAYDPKPLWYRAQQPFRTNWGVNGAVLGLHESDLFFHHECIASGDTFVSALNFYLYRYSWIDTRFGFFQTETFSGAGGLSTKRTHETEKKDTELLKRFFGKAIRKRGGNRAITGPARSPGDRSLHIPW
jgi:hypothetical protein